MYDIQRTSDGYRLTFAGEMDADETSRWLDEVREMLRSETRAAFGVFVDMRRLEPLAEDAQGPMQAGQKLFRERGMTRSVVVVDGFVVKMQSQRIAQQTGIYEYERYVDASAEPDWENVGLAWIGSGVDPDA